MWATTVLHAVVASVPEEPALNTPGEEQRVGAHTHSEWFYHASNVFVSPTFCGLQNMSPILVFFSSIKKISSLP